MNWVGGIKRRVLLQEEERKRQEQFFASRTASSLKQKRSVPVIPKNPKPGCTKRREDDFICRRIQVGKCEASKEENKENLKEWGDEKSGLVENRISRKGVYINRHLKLSSIHGPFSEMLLKMELRGTKKKLEELRRREAEKNKKRYQLDDPNCQDNSKLKTKLLSYTELMQPNTSKIKTPQTQTLDSSKNSQYTPALYRSLNNSLTQQKPTKSNLLEGAPKVRRILTLSPKKLGNKRIWTPILSNSDDLKFPQKVIKTKNTRKSTNESKNPNCETEGTGNGKGSNYLINNTFEANLISKLLGSSNPTLEKDDTEYGLSNSQDELDPEYVMSRKKILNFSYESDSFRKLNYCNVAENYDITPTPFNNNLIGENIALENQDIHNPPERWLSFSRGTDDRNRFQQGGELLGNSGVHELDFNDENYTYESDLYKNISEFLSVEIRSQSFSLDCAEFYPHNEVFNVGEMDDSDTLSDDQNSTDEGEYVCI